MKKVIAVVLSVMLNSIVFASNNNVITNNEDKVVELHVTFAPPPSPEVKKARKLMLKDQTGRAICSGSFVTEFGHILTARHCVQDTTEIEVMTNDGQTYDASIIAVSKRQDLALIQIGRTETPYFQLASNVQKSEPVVILGSPLGLTGLRTEGFVAKLFGDLTFLDCTALPGNSGGPVINSKGQLVGVVSAMVVVLLGPARVSVVQSIDSIKFFFIEIMTGKYSN